MESPPSSPLSEILENISLARTPLKSFSTNIGMQSSSKSKSPFHSSFIEKPLNTSQTFRSSVYIPSVGSTGSTELLQARIEHLERERVDLSLKIHQRDEKDRSFRMKIEQLELQLKNSEQSRADLQSVIENNHHDIAVVIAQKRELEQEVKKLQQEKANQISLESEGLWSKITASARELTRVEEEVKSLHQLNDTLSIKNQKLEQKIETLYTKSSSDELTIKSLTDTTKQIITLRNELIAISTAKDIITAELVVFQEKYQTTQNDLKELKIQFEVEKNQLTTELENAKAAISSMANRMKRHRYDHDDHDGTDDHHHENDEDSVNRDLRVTIQVLKDKLNESETKRRKLHNTLQDLRGNVRVFVRCRPFLKSDREDSTITTGGEGEISGCIKCNIGGTSVTLVGNGRGSGQTFIFDNVFSTTSTQQDIYREVSELVQSAMDGYRVCIFSYGQTGSGKTHTMSGEKVGTSRGIIPRAVEQILQQANIMRGDGWSIVISTSILEIYNEDMKDLLLDYNENNDHLTNKRKTINGNPSQTVIPSQIKISNIQGKTFITGLTSIELNGEDASVGQQQVFQLLDHAAKLRSTAPTSMNEYSSRSHLLFLVDIQAQHEKDPTLVMKGGLRLCDLAGSERLDRTGTLNDATRLKETVNINKSLSSLADVFIALGNKQSHVPYRNSKLTMLLQDCLSGDGKALMLVNVSPTMASCQETLCSLRFASQVSQVELGKASKQIFSLPVQVMIPQQQQQQQVSSQQQYLQPTMSSTASTLHNSRRTSVMPTTNTNNSHHTITATLGSLAEGYSNNQGNESFSHEMPMILRPALKPSISGINSNASNNVSRSLSSVTFADASMSSVSKDNVEVVMPIDMNINANKAGMSVANAAHMVTNATSNRFLSSKRSSILNTTRISSVGTSSMLNPIISNEPVMITSSKSIITNNIVNATTLSNESNVSFQIPTKRPRSSNLSLSTSSLSSLSTNSTTTIAPSPKAGWRFK